jgi:hypothetical protein
VVYHNKAKPAAAPKPKPTVIEFNGLAALMAAAGHTYEDFQFGDISVPMRAITISQMIRLARRFPSLLAIIDSDGETTIVQALIEAGDEAVAALIACSADAEGDGVFEAWLKSAPDDIVLDLAIHTIKTTFRDEDPSVFFTKIAERLEETGLIKVEKLAA